MVFVGFEEMVDMYKDDAEFKDIYAVVQNPIVHNRSQWFNYIIQGVLLFKGNKLCILKCSIITNTRMQLWLSLNPLITKLP